MKKNVEKGYGNVVVRLRVRDDVSFNMNPSDREIELLVPVGETGRIVSEDAEASLKELLGVFQGGVIMDEISDLFYQRIAKGFLE